MYIKFKKILSFLIIVILIALFLQSMHYFLSMFGIASFSNILDGMPFYYGTINYFKYLLNDFFAFLNITFIWSVVFSLYFLLIRYLFLKIFKLDYIKNVFVNLTIYLFTTLFYFEFFADISPTGPDRPIEPTDLFFRLFLIFILPIILIAINKVSKVVSKNHLCL